jgi:hypothetical protein
MEDLRKVIIVKMVTNSIIQGYGPKKSRFSLSDLRKFSGRGFMCLSSLVLISYLHKNFRRIGNLIIEENNKYTIKIRNSFSMLVHSSMLKYRKCIIEGFGVILWHLIAFLKLKN